MDSLKFGRYTVKITNPEKILFPDDNITKADLINYYHEIAPIMVPYMKNRLITLQRFPEGINHEGFFQKDASDYFPSWIKTKSIKKKDGGSTAYVVCNNAATLVYLANQACITPHLWLSKINNLHKPDKMIFDLDPTGDKDFALVKEVALILKKILEDHKLEPYVMTTGSRGLHVVTQLNATADFEVVRTFARDIAAKIAQADPKRITIETRKEKRGTRLLIDYLRNGFTATAVSPYAVRPKPGAPIATPLFWEELDNKKLTSQMYTMKNIFKRITTVGDAWKSQF